MNENNTDKFEERQIPSEPVVENRRKYDPRYGVRFELIDHDHIIRVRSIFDKADEPEDTCFECSSLGLNFNGHPCVFCTAEAGDHVTVPDLDNSLFVIENIGMTGALTLKSFRGDRIARLFSPSEVVKVVWKLTDDDDSSVIYYYGASTDAIMEYARIEGLIDGDVAGATHLAGKLDIGICDGSEDF
jgi:hypothetical protein